MKRKIRRRLKNLLKMEDITADEFRKEYAKGFRCSLDDIEILEWNDDFRKVFAVPCRNEVFDLEAKPRPQKIPDAEPVLV